MNKYFAIFNTETQQFVDVHEAIAFGADVDFQIYPELFSDDEGTLAIMIHEAGKVGEWIVVPVNVNITFTRK